MRSKDFKREIVVYENAFWQFYNKQNQKVKEKINWTIGLIRDLERIPEKYFKHITGTDLYEIRVSSGNNIYRIFCFFDKGRLVIVINGFQKKTQKTPRREIEKAKKIKKRYEDEKGK